MAIETALIVFHRKNNIWKAQELLFYILIYIDRYYISYDLLSSDVPSEFSMVSPTVRQCSVCT